jgi:hypothetical protein
MATVTGHSVDVEIHDDGTFDLHATPIDGNGNPLPGGMPPGWSAPAWVGSDPEAASLEPLDGDPSGLNQRGKPLKDGTGFTFTVSSTSGSTTVKGVSDPPLDFTPDPAKELSGFAVTASATPPA